MTASKGVQRLAWAGMAALALSATTAFAEPYMYVPLGEEGKILIVDTSTDTLVGSMEGVAAVHGLARTPDGRFLIAGSFQEREAGSELPEKPAGMNANEHAKHHGGASAMANKEGSVISTVSILRASDGAVARRIDVPGAVHHVSVSPDGRFAVVTHPNEGAVSAIDLTNYQVVATIKTGPVPNYSVFSPDSKRIFVSNAGNDTISTLDTDRWAVLWNTGVGGSPEHLVLSRDGGTLYVNNVGDGTVSVVSVNERKSVKTIPVDGTLHGIDLSDDGGTLFVAALGEDKVVAIDLDTGMQRSGRLTPSPYHIASVHGAGKMYVSSAGAPKIWVVDQKSLEVMGEIPIGAKGHQMVLGAGT